MKYKEAEDLLYKTKWKTQTCQSGRKCWCRMVVPVKKIKCDDGPGGGLYIAGSGELTKRAAEYFVKLHNAEAEK
jgi:hypothetical protein